MHKCIHSVDISSRMNNNFPGILGIPEEPSVKNVLGCIKHTYTCVFLELMKKIKICRAQRSTGKRRGSIPLSLFPNTHRERLCTVSYTAYNLQWFVPNKTMGSQAHLHDEQRRWRQIMELALELWGNLSGGSSNSDISGGPGADCYVLSFSWKAKFAVSAQPASIL